MTTIPITGTTIVPTSQAFERGLREWVSNGCGLESRYVQPANTGQVAPTVPYATVLLIQPFRKGKVNQRRTINAMGQVEVRSSVRRIDRFSVQWFGSGSRDRMYRFAIWCESPEGGRESKLAVHPFSVVRLVSERQIDGIIYEEFEQRDGVEIDIVYKQTTIETFDRWFATDITLKDGIETVDITVGS